MFLYGCKKADNISFQVPGRPEEKFSLVQLKFESGSLIESQDLASKAFNFYKKDNSEWADRFRVELARSDLYRGNASEAVKLLIDSPPTTDRNLLVARSTLLAIAQASIKLPKAAHQTLEILKSHVPEAINDAEYLSAEGTVSLTEGNYDKAELQFQSALLAAQIAKAEFLETQAWLNLGVVSLELSHFDDALRRFKNAYSGAERGKFRLAQEKSLSNLGWIYYNVGDFKRSIETNQMALQQSILLGASIDQIRLLSNLGMSHFQKGDIVSAQSCYEQAIFLSKQMKNANEVRIAHIRLASLLLQKQDLTSAEVHIDEASHLAITDGNAAEQFEPMLLYVLLDIKRGNAAAAKSRLEILLNSVEAAPALVWEAENLLAGLYEKTGHLQEAEGWYQSAIGTFHRQRLTLKSVELELPFLENGSDLYMGYMEHLIRAGRTGEALRLLDTSRAETLAEGLGTASAQTGKAADPRAVAGRLGATILVYCLRPERSYLWAITGKRQAFYTLPGSGAILPLVARHNEAISGSKDLIAQKDSTGRALYDALVAPAAALLPQDGGRVVLVADSALGRLNFETLIAPGELARGEAGQGKPAHLSAAHYWIEDVSVTNARSLRLLAAGGAARRREKTVADAPKMLLIGDPVYAKGEYAPLPNAASEMAEIAGHFSMAERVVAARQEALPAVYEASRPGRFRFLHFVAHATASELNPLDSAVILSNKDTGKDKGVASGANKLYASEILKQPLSAELVTLSSCYSSGTRNYTGEGVVGLAWAFLRAGAHSVIGSLWEVSDVSTPKLMDTMYTRLLAGDAPDAALRAAKLEMLHSEGVFRKPVYWAAFQLYAGR